MPHHNRARLSEITERNLDPNKKYVAGKHHLVLSNVAVATSDDKKVSVIEEVENLEEVQEIQEETKEKEDLTLENLSKDESSFASFNNLQKEKKNNSNKKKVITKS